MRCPICRGYEVDTFTAAVYIPGGHPPTEHKCRVCGWAWVQPAVYPSKEEASPAMAEDALAGLILERDELQSRLGRLRAFLGSETFLAKVPQQHQVLLWAQSGLMQGYLNILNKRLESPPCTPTT